MVETAAASLAELLKQHRAVAGLTQEELAERANLSARAISDLERGIKHRPYAHTVQRLVQALGLDEDAAAGFRRAARRLGGAAEVALQSIVLPLQPTTFIGRRQEVEEVRTLLGREEVRLLTLIGPGGVGKTRLAVRVAEEVAARFPDGAVFVSLASLADPGLVPTTIGSLLKVKELSGQPILESLIEHLRSKRLLLLLDNFEHLLPAADVVSRLLASCQKLMILVTSRAILHLAAEHEYPVPPLPVPTPMHLPELDALARYDAIQLFVQRARAVKPGFEMTDENAAAITEICWRLDGLPLAIELAAARIRLFPPPALLARLSDRLQFLTGGPRDQPARQQTLRKTIDWSYALLTRDQQQLFARLAVFAGGCTVEAAEAVCNPEGELDLLEEMTSLVEQSLVYEIGHEEPRFSMLETIREYAAEQLEASGGGEIAHAAHARYLLQLAEEAEPELTGAKQGEWLARLEGELDNLREALRWFLQERASEEKLRLAAALHRFWWYRGYWSEGQRWLEEGLAGEPGAVPGVQAKALWALGSLAMSQGDDERARPLLEEALVLYQGLGDRRGSARALNTLGIVAENQGQYERATALYEESLRLSRELGDRRQSALALHNLGLVALDRVDPTTAKERFEEALALSRAVGDTDHIALVLGSLGDILFYEGNLAEAEAFYEQSLTLTRELGAKHRITGVLGSLGEVARRQGQLEQAKDRLRESLLLTRELGERNVTFYLLGAMAKLAMAGGEAERAARLQGAEAALRERLGIPVAPQNQAEGEETLAQSREVLGEKEFARAWEAGRVMSLAEVVAYALGESA